MKIKIARETLLIALQKINSIITTKSSLPILSNVLLQAKSNILILTTTDLDVRIKVEIDANIIQEGETTLPAKKFLEIVRELNGNEVYLEDNNNNTTIECGNSKFKLLGLKADDFPTPLQTDIIRSFSIQQNELQRMLNLVSYAVNIEDARKALNGILFSINENNLTCVATDGRRLALSEKVIENFSGSDGEVIVPVKSANELSRLLSKTGNVKIEIGSNLITFDIDGKVVMTTKLIEENYPNYKQVIPVNFSKKVELPREDFASTIKRVSLVVSERSFYVKVAFLKNMLEVSATSSDVGDSVDSFVISYDGADLTATFNPVFLLDPIQRLDSDKITIKMNDSSSPFAISNEDGFIYIIMPMRITTN